MASALVLCVDGPSSTKHPGRQEAAGTPSWQRARRAKVSRYGFLHSGSWQPIPLSCAAAFRPFEGGRRLGTDHVRPLSWARRSASRIVRRGIPRSPRHAGDIDPDRPSEAVIPASETSRSPPLITASICPDQGRQVLSGNDVGHQINPIVFPRSWTVLSARPCLFVTAFAAGSVFGLHH